MIFVEGNKGQIFEGTSNAASYRNQLNLEVGRGEYDASHIFLSRFVKGQTERLLVSLKPYPKDHPGFGERIYGKKIDTPMNGDPLGIFWVNNSDVHNVRTEDYIIWQEGFRTSFPSCRYYGIIICKWGTVLKTYSFSGRKAFPQYWHLTSKGWKHSNYCPI